MCLKIKSKKVDYKIATEDIECFKFLIACSNGKFYAPYQVFEYELNKLYVNDEFQTNPALVKNSVLGISFTTGNITKAFHSFKTLRDCQDNRFYTLDDVVECFRCIIPKGSRYYEGVCETYDDKEIKSYASDSIIIVEQIED